MLVFQCMEPGCPCSVYHIWWPVSPACVAETSTSNDQIWDDLTSRKGQQRKTIRDVDSDVDSKVYKFDVDLLRCSTIRIVDVPLPQLTGWWFGCHGF